MTDLPDKPAARDAGPSRRAVLVLAGAGVAAAGVAAPPPAAEELPLWPGTPPGGPLLAGLDERAPDQSHDPGRPDRLVSRVAQPRMTVLRPARPNGAAALILPGGGYEVLAIDREGLEPARWLAARGVTAFVLHYRLPGEGWGDRAVVPLQDAQRAIRLIRAGAARFGLDPQRLMVLGFSAGGHLAGSLMTRFAEPTYRLIDAADQLSAQPDLAALLYPVVSLNAPFTHAGSRIALLGPGAGEEARARASVERRVDTETPPCFIALAGDDSIVPPANGIALFQALQAKARPAELHIFVSGGHGFGVPPPPTAPAAAWPRLLMAFASAQGLLPPGRA